MFLCSFIFINFISMSLNKLIFYFFFTPTQTIFIFQINTITQFKDKKKLFMIAVLYISSYLSSFSLILTLQPDSKIMLVSVILMNKSTFSNLEAIFCGIVTTKLSPVLLFVVA